MAMFAIGSYLNLTKHFGGAKGVAPGLKLRLPVIDAVIESENCYRR